MRPRAEERRAGGWRLSALSRRKGRKRGRERERGERNGNRTRRRRSGRRSWNGAWSGTRERASRRAFSLALTQRRRAMHLSWRTHCETGSPSRADAHTRARARARLFTFSWTTHVLSLPPLAPRTFPVEIQAAEFPSSSRSFSSSFGSCEKKNWGRIGDEERVGKRKGIFSIEWVANE